MKIKFTDISNKLLVGNFSAHNYLGGAGDLLLNFYSFLLNSKEYNDMKATHKIIMIKVPINHFKLKKGSKTKFRLYHQMVHTNSWRHPYDTIFDYYYFQRLPLCFYDNIMDSFDMTSFKIKPELFGYFNKNKNKNPPFILYICNK